jgi:hypothetical protein
MKKVKNNKEINDIWCGQEIISQEYYILQSIEEVNWANNSKVLSDIGSGNLIVNNGINDITDTAEAINFLKNLLPIETKVVSQIVPPFAEPTYRTKFNAIDNIITVPVNESTVIDYRLTTEKYVSGGCIIIQNAEFGDYITAEVYDKDSIIPEAYRSFLCENWPSVCKYIEKQFLKVIDSSNCINEINTAPLNAKINAGLYLRVTYYPTNVGLDRNVCLNYYLTKKL